MKILGFLISISIAVLMTTGVQAQTATVTQDSIKIVAKDTVTRDFRPTAIRIGTDVLSLVQNFTKDNFTEYNFSVDVDFYRYFFVVEYGQLEQTLIHPEDGQTPLATYKVDGRYFRFGPEINFLKKDPDQNALFFGFRYAISNFSDELDFSTENGFFGNIDGSISNDNISASWFEMVAGLKVKMWKNLWLGYTARFKVGADDFENNELIPNIIPGYGRAEDNVAWDFNYWIAYRIPFRQQPKPLLQIGK